MNESEKLRESLDLINRMLTVYDVTEADSKVSPNTDDMWDAPSSTRTSIGEGHFSREDIIGYILEDLAKIGEDDLWEVQEIVKGFVNKPEPKPDFYKPYNAPPRRTR